MNRGLFILASVALVFGAVVGLFILVLLTKLPLSVDHTVYKTLGIQKPHIIGFQPFWLLKRADKKHSEHITTFTYFGLTLNNDGTVVKLVNAREEEPGWTTLKSDGFGERLEKTKKDGLIRSLLIHSASESTINALLEHPEEHARNLIMDVSPLMRKHGFADLNLDIESFEKASDEAQMKFAQFVREVKKGIDNDGLGTLTVEMTPTALVKDFLIDAQEIGKLADYVVLMTYDFHYIGSTVSGPVAPVGGAGEVREYDVETSIKEALKVIPAHKIILGIPLYGYEWETLSDEPGGATIPGSGSTASNRRVEELLTDCQDCIRGVGKHSEEPYVIFQDESKDYYHQIFYESQKSLARKLALAKEYKLGGVAVWALGYEGKKLLEPLKQYKESAMWVR